MIRFNAKIAITLMKFKIATLLIKEKDTYTVFIIICYAFNVCIYT